MSDTEDDIPFNRDFPLAPGVADEVVPGVRRVLCNNPSPFTFSGTVSYIVGRGNVAIVDPGPDDEAHAKALLDAVRGETVTHILITHTHRDHSPNAARIKAATGATTYGEGPHRASRAAYASETRTTESGGDRDFRPDIIVHDGDIIAGDGWTLEAIATPGHTANHIAFAWPDRNLIFVGDHVMGWSTSIVAPPDGSMVDYMASLEKLAQRDEQLYFAGHGPEIPDAARYVRFLIRHRKARELVRHVRSINPKAKIVSTADLLGDVGDLYAAGADYVTVTRVTDAHELYQVIEAADKHLLANKREDMDRLLKDRKEVLP